MNEQETRSKAVVDEIARTHPLRIETARIDALYKVLNAAIYAMFEEVDRKKGDEAIKEAIANYGEGEWLK